MFSIFSKITTCSSIWNCRFHNLYNDSLDRQVTEGVNIANFGGEVLMNRRGEHGGVRIERQQYRRWGAN